MNLQFQDMLPQEFSPDSRVWIYQASRAFTPPQLQQVQTRLAHFVEYWQSHGTPVKGSGHVFFNQFIVLVADETASGVSGCSTDSSVRLIKELEQQLDVALFERQQLAFVLQDRITLIPLESLAQAITDGTVDPGTLYFNNTVQTKEQLQNQWIIPVAKSWLARRLNQPRAIG